jgi:two-component system sensor histidine kinase KdpD
MPELQPTPDELLAQIQIQEKRAKEGRLKIFMGAGAGVGKTYAMLAESHQLLERGMDLVVGLAVTHGRKETEALVKDLPVMPPRMVEYKGVLLQEFDLDAVLIRHPKVVVLDELAHTNVPGSRHPKRWQDVQELLETGIDVYTAVNIQHIESLNDVVAQISGVQVKETVPDAIISRADELELIDITPDELRQRVSEGKVYVPEQIAHALDGFFKTSNLTALRELALRTAADQVDAQMEQFRKGEGGHGIWATRERVLICIAPNRLGERVLRTAARIGNASKATLLALYVESARQRSRSPVDREQAERAMARAEELGIEVSRRAGHDIVEEILRFAHSRNVTSIIVGKPIKERWKEICFGSVVDELIRRSGSINVYVVSGGASPKERLKKQQEAPTYLPKDFAIGAGFVLLSTALSYVLYPILPHENVVMIYLLGIALCAANSKIWPALTCSVLSVAAYDFFFVGPRFQFAVSDAAYFPTFMVMLGVGFLISSLTSRLKSEFQRSSERERYSAALYEATKEMAKARGRDNIAISATKKIGEDLEIDTCIFLPDDDNRLHVVSRSRSHFESDHRETPVANWVFDNGRPGGATTDTLPTAKGLYLPLKTSEAVHGVLGARSLIEGDRIDSSRLAILNTYSNGLALALERASLARQSAQARLDVESERLRNALLSSVSHDIRSPLTAIAGAASALRDSVGNPQRLAETIYLESERLNRHVANLLDMTRLESGAVKPNIEWNSLEETVGVALARAEWQLDGREISTSLPEGLPLLQYDSSLIENALGNLIENASKHTPPGSKIQILVAAERDTVTLSVADHGPGIAAADKEKVFEKFHRESEDNEGFGLGLAISRAIARIHDGDLRVSDTPGGGATFSIVLPIRGVPPTVPVEVEPPAAEPRGQLAGGDR